MGAEILAQCRSFIAGLILLLFLSPARAAESTEDGQWTMPSKNPENTRFSRLDQEGRHGILHRHDPRHIQPGVRMPQHNLLPGDRQALFDFLETLK